MKPVLPAYNPSRLFPIVNKTGTKVYTSQYISDVKSVLDSYKKLSQTELIKYIKSACLELEEPNPQNTKAYINIQSALLLLIGLCSSLRFYQSTQEHFPQMQLAAKVETKNKVAFYPREDTETALQMFMGLERLMLASQDKYFPPGLLVKHLNLTIDALSRMVKSMEALTYTRMNDEIKAQFGL